MRKSAFLALTFVVLFAACAWAKGMEPRYEMKMEVNGEGKIVFAAQSNLPDKTNVEVCLYQTKPARKSLGVAVPMDYPASLDTLTVNGGFTGYFDSVYKKGLPAGSYEVCFSILQLQPEQSLGKRNVDLEGEGVIVLENGVKTHSACFPFVLKTDLPAHEKEWQPPAHAWPGAAQ